MNPLENILDFHFCSFFGFAQNEESTKDTVIIDGIKYAKVKVSNILKI